MKLNMDFRLIQSTLDYEKALEIEVLKILEGLIQEIQDRKFRIFLCGASKIDLVSN